jgi:hypothetical protein
MNKSIIGWIFAALVLLACLAVIAVAAIVGFSLNNDLTKSKADLATANQTISDQTKELENEKFKAGQLQTSFDDLKNLYGKTICTTTKELDYSSYHGLQVQLGDFTSTYPGVASVLHNNLTYGLKGSGNAWLIEVNFSEPGSNYTYNFYFFAFPDQKATFFGNDGCWVQTAMQ